MRYVAEDGKTFTSEDECLAYERDVNAKKLVKEKADKEHTEMVGKVVSKAKEAIETLNETDKEYKSLVPDGQFNVYWNGEKYVVKPERRRTLGDLLLGDPFIDMFRYN